jgi:hypothetical protein
LCKYSFFSKFFIFLSHYLFFLHNIIYINDIYSLTKALQTINDDNIIAIYKNTPVTKRCSRCKKNVEESKFINEKNIQSTCNTCHLKNSLHKSKVYQNKENQPFEKEQLIEFENLADELLFVIDEYVDNQENIEYNDQKGTKVTV